MERNIGGMQVINLSEKLSQFSEHWRPKIVARLNGQELKVVKIMGEFPWHSHAEVDEMFFGWKGQFRLEFRDQVVVVSPGECVVVPRGVEHRPVAEQEAEILLFEPSGVQNTGDFFDERFTAPIDHVL